MKTALITAAITGMFAVAVCAADSAMNQKGQGQGPNLAQKKAEVLAHIDERISNSQAEKVCVQSAQTHEALHACREKYRPQRREGGQNSRQQPSAQ